MLEQSDKTNGDNHTGNFHKVLFQTLEFSVSVFFSLLADSDFFYFCTSEIGSTVAVKGKTIPGESEGKYCAVIETR